MTDVLIYGYSDDLVEVEGDLVNNEKEYDAWGGASFLLEAPNGEQCVVFVIGDEDTGCWVIAPGQVNEDIPLPDWNFATVYRPDLCRYSTVLTMRVPEGTVISQRERRCVVAEYYLRETPEDD